MSKFIRNTQLDKYIKNDNEFVHKNKNKNKKFKDKYEINNKKNKND